MCLCTASWARTLDPALIPCLACCFLRRICKTSLAQPATLPLLNSVGALLQLPNHHSFHRVCRLISYEALSQAKDRDVWTCDLLQ